MGISYRNSLPPEEGEGENSVRLEEVLPSLFSIPRQPPPPPVLVTPPTPGCQLLRCLVALRRVRPGDASSGQGADRQRLSGLAVVPLSKSEDPVSSVTDAKADDVRHGRIATTRHN